jgi:hypothetical protein
MSKRWHTDKEKLHEGLGELAQMVDRAEKKQIREEDSVSYRVGFDDGRKEGKEMKELCEYMINFLKDEIDRPARAIHVVRGIRKNMSMLEEVLKQSKNHD